MSAPAREAGTENSKNVEATSQSTSPRRVYPDKPLANPKHSVSSAHAIAAAAEGRGYCAPSNGKTRRKIGDSSAAPPIPADWQSTATKVMTGNMKAYFIGSSPAAKVLVGAAASARPVATDESSSASEDCTRGATPLAAATAASLTGNISDGESSVTIAEEG